jgi:hypothetical protein
LDLAEKNYNNIVEALTKDAIDTALSPPNSASSSLLQSSSTFPNLSNQRDMDRMDNSESFLQNKSDIADWLNNSS